MFTCYVYNCCGKTEKVKKSLLNVFFSPFFLVIVNTCRTEWLVFILNIMTKKKKKDESYYHFFKKHVIKTVGKGKEQNFCFHAIRAHWEYSISPYFQDLCYMKVRCGRYHARLHLPAQISRIETIGWWNVSHYLSSAVWALKTHCCRHNLSPFLLSNLHKIFFQVSLSSPWPCPFHLSLMLTITGTDG